LCGIAGVVDQRLCENPSKLRSLGEAMGHSLFHRGPDQGAVWCDPGAGIVLAHRRLSIVDLSPSGSQPMESQCSRFVIVYNGELYNTEELRCHAAHQSTAWRGHSDTEVLLESIAHRGLDETLLDANGMFAFALYDKRHCTLTLARDRMGIKPLFYTELGGQFAFASELKAFAPLGLNFEIDPRSVTSFLRLSYVPGRHSIFKEVRKLDPGEIVIYRLGEPTVRRFYWD